MPDLDEILQRHLTAIEKGAPKEKVLARLQVNEQELAPLIDLAYTMRSLPHPSPSPGFADALHEKLIAAARENAIPTSASRQFPKVRRLGWLPVSGLFGAATVALVLIVALLGFGLWTAGPGNTRVATLQQLDGVAEVASTGNNWRQLNQGDKLRAGQHIRTSEGSNATLTFADGSTVTLSPNTDLTLQTLSGKGQKVQIKLDQTAGMTQHVVVPLTDVESYYIVQTPNGVARVYGTNFDVLVNQKGLSRFSVNTGQVTVTNDSDEVTLLPGQATISQSGQAPQPPTYEFVVLDKLISIEDSTWIVDGTPVQVTDQTYIDGSPEIGEILLIQGRILTDGQWVADSIETSPQESVLSFFSGVIDSMQGTRWTISGMPIQVNEATEIGRGLDLGDTAKVDYVVLKGGQWLALSVDELLHAGGAAQSEQTLNTPAEEPVTTTESSAPVTPAFTVECALDQPLPMALELVAKHPFHSDNTAVTAEEIMGWICQGYSFNEIDLAYSISEENGVSVADILDLRWSGLGWGVIRKATPTSVPGVTTAESQAACKGSEIHPVAMTLAAKYGVSYDKIMGYFCDGFGFGEIDLAFSLAGSYGNLTAQSGAKLVSVDDILAMNKAGMSWGEIKQWLSNQSVEKTTGKPTEKPGGKPEDNQGKKPTPKPDSESESRPTKKP